MKFQSGAIVTLILQNPREKILGVLQEINASGVFLRGIDLNYFDEWTTAIKNAEPFLPMQENFLPMWRVEKITLDESQGELLSMSEEFRRRTGFDIFEF